MVALWLHPQIHTHVYTKLYDYTFDSMITHLTRYTSTFLHSRNTLIHTLSVNDDGRHPPVSLVNALYRVWLCSVDDYATSAMEYLTIVLATTCTIAKMRPSDVVETQNDDCGAKLSHTCFEWMLVWLLNINQELMRSICNAFKIY